MCVCLCACVYEYDILLSSPWSDKPTFHITCLVLSSWFATMAGKSHSCVYFITRTYRMVPASYNLFFKYIFLPQVIYITDFVVKDQLSNLWGPILAREFNPIETHRRHSSYVFSAGLQRSQGSSRILLVAASAGDAQCSRDSNIINEGFNQQTMGNLPSKIKATNLWRTVFF